MKIKILSVCSVFLLFIMSCASNNVVEEPVDSPAKIAALEEEGAIDISSYKTADTFAMEYDAENYALTCDGGEYFMFELPEIMNAGEVITVHITGTNNGTTGFRSWVVDENQTTLSDPIYTDTAFDGLAQGDFDVIFLLNATEAAKYLFIKGPKYGTMIEKLTIKSLSVVFN